MPADIERAITTRMTPAPVRTVEGLLWKFESKAEVHWFVTKLNDLIMNDLYFRTIKYSGAGTEYFSNREPDRKITMTPDVEAFQVKLVIRE